MIEPSKLASLPFFQGISPEDMAKLLEELDAREVFYEKHGFTARPTRQLGPGMIQYIRVEES